MGYMEKKIAARKRHMERPRERQVPLNDWKLMGTVSPPNKTPSYVNSRVGDIDFSHGSVVGREPASRARAWAIRKFPGWVLEVINLG